MKLGDEMDSIEIPDHLQRHFLSGLGMFFWLSMIQIDIL